MSNKLRDCCRRMHCAERSLRHEPDRLNWQRRICQPAWNSNIHLKCDTSRMSIRNLIVSLRRRPVNKIERAFETIANILCERILIKICVPFISLLVFVWPDRAFELRTDINLSPRFEYSIYVNLSTQITVNMFKRRFVTDRPSLSMFLCSSHLDLCAINRFRR